MSSEASFRSGTRVGNYILMECVGAGAFAEVWKACHHEHPDRTFALKIAVDPTFRRQLSREGRRPDIGHPNVVPILDSDTRFSDVPYIVMPLVPGGNLAGLIAQHPGGLPEDRAGKLLLDIVNGVAAAHKKKVVHRDIKPSNILIGDYGQAMVTDFGLCSHAGPDALASLVQSISQESDDAKSIVGTLAYMAPEVVEGGDASASSDVYSIGVLMFEMLVGRRPGGLELPSKCRSNLPRAEWWDSLFYWSHQRDKSRYRTASEMLDAMKAGPQPHPFGSKEIVEPARAQIVVPESAPLPDDLWKGLGLRWREYVRVAYLLSDLREETTKALSVYTEQHREVQRLQKMEVDLARDLDGAKTRFREVCDQMADRINSRLDLRNARRKQLLGEGCRPVHPDVARVISDLETLEAFKNQLTLFCEFDSRADCGRDPVPGRVVHNKITGFKTHWQRAVCLDTLESYNKFIRESTSEPLVRLAKHRKQTLLQRKSSDRKS